MTIRNPHRTDGTFSAAEKFAALDAELRRSKPVLEGWVRGGRMKRVNFEAKIGALEAVLEDLRAEMVIEQAKTPSCVWTGPRAAIVCATPGCGMTFDYRDGVIPVCPLQGKAS